MYADLGIELLSTAAFAVVGIAIMLLGYVVLDLLTPGHLGRKVFLEHNRDAALLLASGFVAIGMIVATAIWTSEGDFGLGLATTAGYGLLGVVLLGVAFLVVDLATPGKLGDILTDDSDDPAVWVTVGTQLALGLIVAASMT